MFDIGFWELFLIFGIALIVLGPERLPVAARTVGLWTGRARAFVRNLSNELDREVRKSEAAQSFSEAKRMMQENVGGDAGSPQAGAAQAKTAQDNAAQAKAGTAKADQARTGNGQTPQPETKAESVQTRE